MDAYAAASTAIEQIYIITIFIRHVIKDAKEYGSDRDEIQRKLENDFVFVEIFKYLYFDGQDSLSHTLTDPKFDNLRADVMVILEDLKSTLAKYFAEAALYGINLYEDIPPTTVTAVSSGPSATRERHRDRFSAAVIAKYNKLRLKAAPLNWAIFGKEKIEKLLEDYNQCTLRLRNDLGLITLLEGRIKTLNADDGTLTDLGIQELFDRQNKIASSPPSGYSALQGSLDMDVPLEQSGNFESTVTRNVYRDVDGIDDWDVLVEVRRYSNALNLAMDAIPQNPEEVVKQKEPLSTLAWLLEGPFSGRGTLIPDSHQLKGMGLIDQPQHHRAILIYRTPQSSQQSKTNILSLHDLIHPRTTQPPTQKPPLGTRFAIAHTVASILFDIFASGWVHKNISSRTILLLENYRPYLVGWGAARRVIDDTVLANDIGLESNIFRHPERYGKPEVKFNNKHDIYALGVVLLEIGIWNTMSSCFEPHIQASEKKGGELPEFKRVRAKLEKLAIGEGQLRQDMGEQYVKIVQKCLFWTNELNLEDDDEQQTKLSIKFRKTVVEGLQGGSML